RKELESKLHQYVADLSEADRRKDEFLATLAHELRNPLAPIRNGLELVRLVDDLMDVSRITRGKVDLRVERISLGDVVASAVESSRPLIDDMGHELVVTLPARPVFVNADATRLAQVIANLLANSAKYTERGGHIWLAVERQ